MLLIVSETFCTIPFIFQEWFKSSYCHIYFLESDIYVSIYQSMFIYPAW